MAPKKTTTKVAPKPTAKSSDGKVQEPDLASVFEQAVGFVLADQIEGGYVNDPRDPGGETNFGISKRSYPRVDMNKLTRAGAIAIYKRDYWDAANCDDLPPKVAVAVFDCAINQGVSIAKKLLQRAAGATPDGAIGPMTLAAVHKADQDELVIQFLGWRLRRYAHTANSATYMRGWSNRVLYLQAFVNTELVVK